MTAIPVLTDIRVDNTNARKHTDHWGQFGNVCFKSQEQKLKIISIVMGHLPLLYYLVIRSYPLAPLLGSRGGRTQIFQTLGSSVSLQLQSSEKGSSELSRCFPLVTEADLFSVVLPRKVQFLIKTINNKLSHFAKCNKNREGCWPVWGLGEAGWNCVCILKASSQWLQFPAPWPANLSYVRAIPSNWDHVYNWTMASAVISPG